MSRSNERSRLTEPNHLVLDLFSRDGIRPFVVQYVDPELYALNNRHEDSLETGSKCVPTGYPPDEQYPSDSREDALAFHPLIS